MRGKRSLGFAKIIFVLAIFLIVLTAIGRRYAYLSYQHLGQSIGFNLNNINSNSYVSWIKSQKDEFVASQETIFLNRKVDSFHPTSIAAQNILGETEVDDNKWIEVDLSEQRLYMKEGGTTVGSFLVSTGKWSPTPAGEWRIWTKLRYTRMQGGSQALGTYYNLPNVPYVMYYDRGYGIHGAYWHNNFGTTMSHGCTNMKPEEAGIVFNWASVGTKVIVHQ